MRKAKIHAPEVCDRLALHYCASDQPQTIIEVAVMSSAAIGERVALKELTAERTLIRSRWLNSVKVVHITAKDWRYLRGAETATEPLMRMARDILPTK